jgi:hypothetical protein|tara:strand:- start:274 stop:561 length:288 start_codon:yes stop_codon:yes gene_type:complete
MPRFHNINGERVQFTAEEEAQRDAEEQAWENGAFDRAIADLRLRRNALLSATDFYALSDVTMSDEMKQYRQDLRDMTEGLSTKEEVEAKEFPTKP